MGVFLVRGMFYYLVLWPHPLVTASLSGNYISNSQPYHCLVCQNQVAVIFLHSPSLLSPYVDLVIPILHQSHKLLLGCFSCLRTHAYGTGFGLRPEPWL